MIQETREIEQTLQSHLRVRAYQCLRFFFILGNLGATRVQMIKLRFDWWIRSKTVFDLFGSVQPLAFRH